MIDLGIDEITGIGFLSKVTVYGLGVTTQKVFRDVGSPFGTIDCTCAAYAASSCDDNLDWTPFWWHRIDVFLNAPITQIKSTDFVVTGQTTGYESYCGCKEKYDVVTGDPFCAILVNPTTYIECEPIGKTNFIIDIYDQLERGYDSNEVIDITFTRPTTTPIQSITFRDANSIFVNSIDHSMVKFAWLKLSGTGLYDGNWRVDGVTDDGQFWISDPGIWIGPSSGGQFDPIFDIASEP